MRQRVAAEWHNVGDSLWFVPATMSVLAVGLALGLVQLDRQVWPNAAASSDVLFGGGVDGARSVLAAIAGSLITVTATVFSITMVVLQLASSQFTPRVLRTFTGDRGVQVVLGVFIATFTYELLVLRTIRGENEDEAAFIPSVAVSVGILLALVSIGVLIYFVHHVSRSIQVTVMIDRAANDTLGLVAERYPAALGEPAPALAGGDDGELDPPPTAGEHAWMPAEAPAVVRSDGDGYLQHLDETALFAAATDGVLTIAVAPRLGEYVLPGAVLASIWPAGALDDDLAGRLRRAFVLGIERSLQADVVYGVRQLADIAIRALSPGVNDPTTATICVDRLGAVLVHFANRAPPARLRADGAGAVVVVPTPTFDHLVETAFVQIRHYGAGDPAVAVHLVRTLGGVAELVPARCREPLARQARLTLGAARRQLDEPADIVGVEQAAAWATVP